MRHTGWVKTLHEARKRPAMFVGSPPTAHLWPVTQLLRLLWETHAFPEVHTTTLTFSPTQFVACCSARPLRPEIEGLIDWDSCYILFSELSDAGIRLAEQARQEGETWREPFRSSTFGFGTFGHAFFLADRGLLGVRTRAGVWCQAYERGWPTTAPVLVQTDAPVGVIFAAALSPEWFPGLPYTPEQVEAAVPRAAKPHVRLDYRPADDLVTERVLRAENVRDWL